MLAQRSQDPREGVASKKPTRPKTAGKSAPPAADPKAGKRRLSFHEKHALETLPQQIATLQERVGQLQQRLDDPHLYARDRAAFADISNSLAAAQVELASAEEKWLKLEILREEIEDL
jgi:ATP-binding cassette subfamily F protein uup